MADLVECGSLGCQVTPAKERGFIHLDAYFPESLPEDTRPFPWKHWQELGVVRLQDESLPERDWLEDYRGRSRPFVLGKFRIDPRDPEEYEEDAEAPREAGLIPLKIPAQTAFGLGTHESTRLAARWLEDLAPQGLDVLDVGTGSGILAFMALHLGARRVVGFDLDAQAVCIARRNGCWNNLSPTFFAGRLHALGASTRFDLALVNVLPERIIDEFPALLSHLRPGATLISSGNLVERRDELLECFGSLGLDSRGEYRDGDWVAFHLGKRTTQ